MFVGSEDDWLLLLMLSARFYEELNDYLLEALRQYHPVAAGSVLTFCLACDETVLRR